MKRKTRIIARTGAILVAALAAFGFAGCDTSYPEVKITYEFNGKKYDIEYTLTRNGAPQTVQHFLELADAGYYDGTVIHNYDRDGVLLYGGGYVLDSQGDLEEKDYFSEVKRLESEKGITFTQSVFYEDSKDPMYTVRGEFKANGVEKNNKAYSQTFGALVMYYMGKGSDNTRVSTLRNDGKEVQDGDYYKYNCATSLFYTVGSQSVNSGNSDDEYCTFGMVKDSEKLQDFLNAIKDYADTRSETDPFAVDRDIVLNQYDPFEQVKNAKITATYSVPTEPIKILTVKVTKY